MKRKYFYFLLTIITGNFFCQSVSGQKRLYLGFELGPTIGFNRVTENQNVHKAQALGGAFGVVMSYGLKNQPIFIDLGIYKININEKFYFVSPDQLKFGQNGGFGSHIKGIMLPLDFRYLFNFKDQIFLSPVLGIGYLKTSKNSNNFYGYQIAKKGSISDSLTFSGKSTVPSKSFLVFRTGFNLEWILFRNFLLSFNCRYSLGLSPISKTEMNLQFNNGASHPAKVLANGNNLSISLGLKIPINIR